MGIIVHLTNGQQTTIPEGHSATARRDTSTSPVIELNVKNAGGDVVAQFYGPHVAGWAVEPPTPVRHPLGR
jgi:hypothetical protein